MADLEEDYAIKDVARSGSTGLQILIIIVSIIHLAVFTFYFGYGWAITLFDHHFPKMATPPHPGTFFDRRYDFYSWFLSALIVQIFIPYVMLWLARDMKSIFRADTSRITIAVFFFAGIATAIIMTVAWFSANTEMHPHNFFNDYKYCCLFWGSHPGCPNDMDCIPQPSMLEINGVGILHLVMTWIILPILAFVQFVLGSAARNYAILGGNQSFIAA